MKDARQMVGQRIPVRRRDALKKLPHLQKQFQ
jgi:hypothetical protein